MEYYKMYKKFSKSLPVYYIHIIAIAYFIHIYMYIKDMTDYVIYEIWLLVYRILYPEHFIILLVDLRYILWRGILLIFCTKATCYNTTVTL